MLTAVADTSTRVAEHTAENVNWQLRHRTEANILHCALKPEHISQRLRELDREWDIERTLEINYAIVNLAGLALGRFWPKWYLLPAVAGVFMLQHTLQGWCPPLAVFRRMGIRTAQEIEAERHALKAIRGDYDSATSAQDEQTKARRAMEAVGV